ncbi:hypothetical protein [Streptomyces virginiae]|uniref:hypothetical protein n=1 Tax=Streptomyces virginiae TaxID=1961 RepID=UPI001FCBF1B3|nr:hypothetical protein [Streptomyces virginiae]
MNPVGQPRSALEELRRVTRPGGRTAVTIWATPAAAGQTLLGRAVLARDEQGLAGQGAALRDIACRTLLWDRRTTP